MGLFGRAKIDRSLRRLLRNCDYEFAQELLQRNFRGSALPSELLALLQAFNQHPGPATAAKLLEFDAELASVFVLAQIGELAQQMWRSGMMK